MTTGKCTEAPGVPVLLRHPATASARVTGCLGKHGTIPARCCRQATSGPVRQRVTPLCWGTNLYLFHVTSWDIAMAL